MNVKEKFRKVLEALNLVDKATSKELTNEDWKAIVDAYQKEFQVTLQDDMAADQASHQNPLDQEAMNQAQAILDSIIVRKDLNCHHGDPGPEGDNGISTNDKPQNASPASPETVAQSAGLVKAIVDGLKIRRQPISRYQLLQLPIFSLMDREIPLSSCLELSILCSQ